MTQQQEAFTKNGQAFVKNASGRVVDVPEVNLALYLSQGYKPASEQEVRDSAAYKSVFTDDKPVDDAIERALGDQMARGIESLGQRIRARDDFAADLPSMGGEVHPPQTSKTADGFPKQATAKGPLVEPRVQTAPVPPIFRQGQAPDNLREAVGRVAHDGQMLSPEEAVKQGVVDVIVSLPSPTVTVTNAAAQPTTAPAPPPAAPTAPILTPDPNHSSIAEAKKEGAEENADGGDENQKAPVEPQQGVDVFADDAFGDKATATALRAAGLDTYGKIAAHDFTDKPVANVGKDRLKKIQEVMGNRES